MPGSVIIQNPLLIGSPLLKKHIERSCTVMHQLRDEGFTVLRLEINGYTSPMITVLYDHRCEFLERDGQAAFVKEVIEGDKIWETYQINCQDCDVIWEKGRRP